MLFVARISVQSTDEPCPCGRSECDGAIQTTYELTQVPPDIAAGFMAAQAASMARAPVGPYGLAGAPLLFPGGGVVR